MQVAAFGHICHLHLGRTDWGNCAKKNVFLCMAAWHEEGVSCEPLFLSLVSRLGDWTVESTFISSLSDLPKGVPSPPLLRQAVPYKMRGRERERPEHMRIDSSEERESPPPHRDWGLQPGRRQGLAKWLDDADSSFFGQTQVGGRRTASQPPVSSHSSTGTKQGCVVLQKHH